MSASVALNSLDHLLQVATLANVVVGQQRPPDGRLELLHLEDVCILVERDLVVDFEDEVERVPPQFPITVLEGSL
jgi:hypothetical protein